MKKYIITKDFLAHRYQSGGIQTTQAVAPKQFLKNDIVDASEQTDIAYKKHIVSGMYDITSVAMPYKETTTNKSKYIFIKDFSIRVLATAAGRTGRDAEGEGDGKITLRYKVGDKVEGTDYVEGGYLVIMPYANLYVNIPFQYLQKDSTDEPKGGSTETPKDTIFTTKNILIGAAIAVGVYFLFFAKNPILKINK